MFRNIVGLVVLLAMPSYSVGQGWNCVGGNAQHSGIFNSAGQSANVIKWQAPLDDNRSYYGSSILAHYASPMITLSNTVVHGFRFTASGTGSNQYDNWRVVARSGGTGSLLWQFDTDYSSPQIWPNGWTTVFPVTLCQSSLKSNIASMVAAGSGGSLLARASADAPSSTVSRLVFYTTEADFNANKAALSVVKINTPLTCDKANNVYFGYEVTGNLPAAYSGLGTGGVAKVNVNSGKVSYASIQTLGIDGSLTRPARSAAPALSLDETSVYFAFTGGSGILAKINCANLAAQKHVLLQDPAITNANAYLIDQSSASPTVGPDGHVFMGVFGNQWRQSHGWMLQFDRDLNAKNSAGKRFPVGAFGWDDTPSIVPVSLVPSYRGKATYLLLCKYNNYNINGSDPGADGLNKVAVIDPTADTITIDRQSGIPVMNEILTVVGPNKTNDDPAHPEARFEWCINSAAIDVKTKSAIINSEDGHMYRWSFVTGTLVESLNLQPPTGEAYTSTAIGPDGQLYAVNNSILFAIGSRNATGVSMYQGTNPRGALADIWASDGTAYAANSVSTPAGAVVGIEADFTVTESNPTTLNIGITSTATPVVTGQIYLYNYSTSQFVLVSSQALSIVKTLMTAQVTSNVSQFIGPNKVVRVLARAVAPSRLSSSGFVFGIDQATLGAR